MTTSGRIRAVLEKLFTGSRTFVHGRKNWHHGLTKSSYPPSFSGENLMFFLIPVMRNIFTQPCRKASYKFCLRRVTCLGQTNQKCSQKWFLNGYEQIHRKCSYRKTICKYHGFGARTGKLSAYALVLVLVPENYLHLPWYHLKCAQ